MEDAIPIQIQMTDHPRHNITDVINAYSKRLLKFISNRVARAADAEDILQEVFYQLAGSLTPVEQVGSWLFTVARNKITDQHRKKKPDLFADLYGGKNEDTDEPGLSFILPGDTDSPESVYVRTMFWEELDRALQELPPEQKEAFILHEIEGLPFAEIAQLTGVPVNTLLSRKRYAVLNLREQLRELYDEFLND